MNCRSPIAVLALTAGVWTWWEGRPAPLSPDRELASLFPERCGIYFELTGHRALLEQGLEHPFVRVLGATELGQFQRTVRDPEQALARADAWLGTPLLPLIADLTGRGISLGFDPATKKAVVVSLGRDGASVAAGLATAVAAVEQRLGLPGALDRPLERRGGAELWRLGDEVIVARRGELLVVGNERELVEDVLDLAGEPTGRGLLVRPGFAAHHAEKPRDALAWAWLELAELEPHGDQGFRDLRAANRTPVVQGLLGAEIGALFAARALSATLSLADDRGLELALHAFEAPSLVALAPGARSGELPARPGGESLAEALLYRDYARFFVERTELFPPETLPGFAEAITNGALFFEGEDLGADVLPHLSPWIRLVSRELEFGAGREPEIPLPGLAAVAVLDDELEAERWIAAFQTIVAIASVDQARKGGRSLRLHLAREGAVEISAARFPTPAPGDGVDLRYNLEPALAAVGRHLVLGTHLSLVRDIVRELERSEPGPAGSGPELLELDVRGLRALAERNLEFLIARKMIEDGLDRAAAEREIGGLRLALASLEHARIRVRSDDPRAPEVRLELRLTPEEPR